MIKGENIDKKQNQVRNFLPELFDVQVTVLSNGEESEVNSRHWEVNIRRSIVHYLVILD